MRTIISLLLLSTSFFLFAQRVSFEDPDLTFSFKKPKNWEVFDDGYVVKLSPSAKDTSSIYFTITYFESAQPFGSFPTANAVTNFENTEFTKTKIDGREAKRFDLGDNGAFRASYTFIKLGQRFEIHTTGAKEHERYFRKIIRSIRIVE